MGDEVNRASETGEVPGMYVRNIPEQLLRQVRAQAALRGETMRDLVVRAVTAELERLGVDVPDDWDNK